MSMASELHDQLRAACRKLPQDYEPFGQQDRTSGDCSSGCRFYSKLAGRAGSEWGTCRNPESHRAGLLTFEHQGCTHFDPENLSPVEFERRIGIQTSRCGCFHCLAVFAGVRIDDWVDEGRTALCPMCGVDSVVSDYDGSVISEAELKRLQALAFGTKD
jgi:hypothetical protein